MRTVRLNSTFEVNSLLGQKARETTAMALAVMALVGCGEKSGSNENRSQATTIEATAQNTTGTSPEILPPKDTSGNKSGEIVTSREEGLPFQLSLQVEDEHIVTISATNISGSETEPYSITFNGISDGEIMTPTSVEAGELEVMEDSGTLADVKLPYVKIPSLDVGGKASFNVIYDPEDVSKYTCYTTRFMLEMSEATPIQWCNFEPETD